MLLLPHVFVVLAVETPFASTKNSAFHAALVALAVFLQTFCLLALAPLTHLLVLHTQTKTLALFYVLVVGQLGVLEPVGVGVGVSGQSLNDGLLVLLLIGGVVAAVEAIAGLWAEGFLLETFTVKFQTSRTFAVAASPSGLSLLLFQDLRDDNDIAWTLGVAPFRELRAGISNGVAHWETLLELFFERFSEGLGINRMFVLYFEFPAVGVFSGGVVFDGGGD
jgi:hypothetical protein